MLILILHGIESYYACRLKAKKAEDISNLNSDCPTKRIIKKNRYYDNNYDVSSDSDNDANDRTLSSPLDLQDYFDTEIQTSNIRHDSNNNNNLPTSSVKGKCYKKENRRP